MATTSRTPADRAAVIQAALAGLPLDPTSRRLADAFIAYVATTGHLGDETPATVKGLLVWLQRAGGFAVPKGHQDILALLRVINQALRITAPAFNDPPFLIVVRNVLMAAMLHPARSYADVGAKIRYLDETTDERGLGEWVWCEGRERERVQFQLGRDLGRFQRVA